MDEFCFFFHDAGAVQTSAVPGREVKKGAVWSAPWVPAGGMVAAGPAAGAGASDSLAMR